MPLMAVPSPLSSWGGHMSDAVLILRTAAGQLKFDSRHAAGGVCLGIFAIPVEGISLEFRTLPRGRTPIVVYGDGQGHAKWTYDETQGYPRFSFKAVGFTPTAYSVTAGVYLK